MSLGVRNHSDVDRFSPDFGFELAIWQGSDLQVACVRFTLNYHTIFARFQRETVYGTSRLFPDVFLSFPGAFLGIPRSRLRLSRVHLMLKSRSPIVPPRSLGTLMMHQSRGYCLTYPIGVRAKAGVPGGFIVLSNCEIA